MNLDWFTGFYEGEGCPTYNCSGKRGKRKYLRLMIVQTERIVLFRARRFLKTIGLNSNVWPRRDKRAHGKSWKSSWVLAIAAPDSVILAKKMLPKMQSKNKAKQLRDAIRGKYHAAGKL